MNAQVRQSVVNVEIIL